MSRLIEDVFQVTGLSSGDDKNDPAIYAIAIVALVSFAWAMASGSLLLALLSKRGFGFQTNLSLKRTVELVVIETIRAISATLIRFPLLILPGIFEWIRLTPIPFLVILDSEYQAGREDILKRSRQFFSENKLRVLLLLIPTAIIFLLELMSSSSPGDVLPFWEAPVQHIWSITGFALLHIASDSFVLSRYQVAIKNKS